MEFIKLDSEKKIRKVRKLPFNRELGFRHDLSKSMGRYGFAKPALLLETDLISGKRELFILDGTHSIDVALYLEIVPYVAVVTQEELKLNTISDILEFVSTLNSTQKNWVIQNYVDCYAYLGNRDYQQLLKLQDKSPFTLVTIAYICSGMRDRNEVSKNIKDGTFKIRELDFMMQFSKFSSKLSQFGRLSSRMGYALCNVMRDRRFNEEIFYNKYKENYKSLKELALDDYNAIFISWLV
jgi:hypothetical protein